MGRFVALIVGFIPAISAAPYPTARCPSRGDGHPIQPHLSL